MTIDGVEFSESLETIITELVSQLRANGLPYIQKWTVTPSDVQVCCPYHKEGLERRPSAGIRKRDGLFHCLACGETHSLAEVISYCFEKDKTGFFGWNWLLKNFASIEIESRKPLELDYTRNEKVQSDRTFVTEEELDSYRYFHPYMYKRKLTDKIIELFDIGYDQKTECITFPNRDINGNCLFVARRSVKTKYFNYPQGVEKPVYGLYELSKCNYISGDHKSPSVIICESMLDALTCWVYGKPAVALNGLGTEKQFKTLREFPCRRYILATDMDDRGLAARPKIKKALYNSIVTEYIWDKSIAKDINDMDREYFNSLEEYF